jgi:hypothetical protein
VIIVSPYCSIPSYADVDYIDGKLKVARLCVQSSNAKTRKNWLAIIDRLLELRSMLEKVENGDYR